MAETLQLAGADGHRFAAERWAPPDARRGGLILIHEIFGLAPGIAALAAGFAAEGYEVLAPSLFDRLEPGFRSRADAAGVARGRALSEATPWDQVAGDLAAAIAWLEPPVFTAGYCWGGTAAWLAAARCAGLAAVSSYYGRRIPEILNEAPACPIILHFGRDDPTIPPTTVEAIAERYPDLPIHLYPAGHGFASDRAADHDADSARLAHLRTLRLFSRHAGDRGEF